MKTMKIIISDLRFQRKYGFYFIYIVLMIVYAMVLSVINGSAKKIVGEVLVYSDPAAIGMFFMGAIVLLEKSERVLNSLAVSPMSIHQYICGKIVSMAVTGCIVGLVIGYFAQIPNIVLLLAGILLSSVLFTLFGLIVGTWARSLNQYIVGTMPFEILGFLPPVLYIFKLVSDEWCWYPGVSCIKMIQGNADGLIWGILISIGWVAVFYIISYSRVKKMFQNVG